MQSGTRKHKNDRCEFQKNVEWTILGNVGNANRNPGSDRHGIGENSHLGPETGVEGRIEPGTLREVNFIEMEQVVSMDLEQTYPGVVSETSLDKRTGFSIGKREAGGNTQSDAETISLWFPSQENQEPGKPSSPWLQDYS